MTFTVRVSHSEHAFPCEAGESLLEAAGRAGFEIPYSCRKGVCLTCSGKVVAGTVEASGAVRTAPVEALFCAARPRSDLLISPRRIARAVAAGAPREAEARVFRLAEVGPGVVRLHLRFPIGVRVAFRAGQSLDVLLQDGARRTYSMANSPGESDGVELHVRIHPGGAFSDRLLRRLRPGDALRLHLPHGTVAPDGADPRPLLLLATGTGLAPAASILEEAVRRRWTRPLVLYRGGRTQADLYLPDLPRRWERRLRGFRHVPVLSRGCAAWPGHRGYVQDALAAEWPDLAGAEVYASGSPAMVAAAWARCLAGGLPPEAFHADAFVPADASA